MKRGREKKKEKAAAGRPAGGKRGRAGTGIFGYLALTWVLCAAIGAVAVAAAMLADQGEQRAIRHQQAVSRAGMVAERIGGWVTYNRQALAGLAGDTDLTGAVSRHDEGAVSSLVARYRPLFTGAIRLAGYPAGMQEPDLDAQPPIGYALLDMMKAARQSGKAPPVEVHLPGQPEAQINFVQPVVVKDQVQATLVLTFPAERLRRMLGAAGVDGVRMEQRAGGDQIDLASVGRVSGAAVAQPVEGTRWTVQVDLPERAAGLAGLRWPRFALAAGGGAVALLVAVFAVGALLRRAVRADAGTLAGIVEDARTGQVKAQYPATLAESRPAVAAATAGARELAASLRQSRQAAKQAERGVREPEEAPPPDIVSGLEVTESEGEDMDEFSAEEPVAEPAAESAPPTPSVNVNPSIFRAYDIRGVVDQTLNAEVMQALGQAIGSEAASRGQQQVVVGRDGRLSSPDLADGLIAGLIAAGRQVIDIGRVPTPVMYFATHYLETHTGVEVTGSHNPSNYNGLKIMIAGETLSGEAIQALGTRIAQGNLVGGEGWTERRDVLPDYIDRVAQDVLLHRPLKVVVDCGNGVTGEVAPQLLRAIGCEVEELFCDVDGRFPNHHPDPTVPENLDALISYVRLQKADLGLAFDGDGDRLGVVDSGGKIIWPDRQLMLYARDVLSRQPGEDIIFDVKCTSALADIITEAAGVPRMWKTGHSLIKAKLRETGAPLAGEMSGHIFFNDRWYGFDDGMYTAARLLEIVSGDERGSAEIFAELPEGVSTPELRVELAEGEPPQVMEALVARADFQDARVTDIDGLRVDFPDGWGLVRASNTQPSLVLRFEGRDQETLERIEGEFRQLLLAAKPDLALPF